MSPVLVLNTLETDRLALRPQRVSDAAVYRQLWTELRAIHDKGYATEAGLAVVRWAGDAGYRRLWATVWDWNVASRRVLEKLGFSDTSREAPETVHGRSVLTALEF